MKNSVILVISTVSGLVLTLISGLTPSTPQGLVGAGWFGYPFTWLYRLVLAPQYNPWRFNAAGFVSDLVVYAVLIAAVLLFTRATLKLGSK